jgi:amino acid adenylation domain-containing protein
VAEQLLHRNLQNAGNSSPEHPAVVIDGNVLTYRMLEVRSRQFSAWMTDLGVSPGDRIAVCLPKSLESVIAIYGTLMTGAAYVPVDTRTPVLRLIRLLANAACRVVLTTESVAGQLYSQWPVSEVQPKILGFRHPDLEVWTAGIPAAERFANCDDSAADAAAAILYTSGSTGQSKGVVLTHRNIMCFVEWSQEYFGLRASDQVASIAPFHFDLSTFDLFATHAAGATVILMNEQTVMFPAAVSRNLESEQVSICYAVPTTWIQLLQRGQLSPDSLRQLRHVIFAGEVFPVAPLRRLMNVASRATFTNLYGPVETNVCTFHTLSEVPGPDETEIPIGRACRHATVLVLDQQGVPVQAGEIGEVCVKGPGVTPGYWKMPEQTEACRVDGDPVTYRTGDLATIDVDGCMWFRGRVDHQVKIRGHRIDPGEIESTLASHSGVLQTVVVVVRTSTDAWFVAFVQPGKTFTTVADLQQYAAARLPFYARPREIIVLDAFPLTSSGKIDRMGLLRKAGDVNS